MSLINFIDIDTAYTQTEDIYKLIQNDGNKIIKDLEKLCLDLKEKWTAQDAPIHINNLVAIHTNLKKYFIASTTMIVEVSNRVVDIQEAVSRISKSTVPGINLIDQFEGTKDTEEEDSSVSYKLESLQEDYRLLDEICSSFMAFKNTYALEFDEFFENWKDDPKKKKIEETYDGFIKNLDDYQKILEDTRQALGIATANTEQILEG